MANHIESEFARPVVLSRLGDEPLVESIAAQPGERAALAQRFGLVAVDRLEATIRVERRKPGSPIVAVSGDLLAEVVQTCVVTLEPMPAQIEEHFSQRFNVEPGTPITEVVVDVENEEEPEPLEGDSIDIGELVAQYLSLALDPYPRLPGARFEYQGPQDTAGAESPFAALDRLYKPRRS